jgi:hypothetical protein
MPLTRDRDETALKQWRSLGSLGSEFYISTGELRYVMNREFFNSLYFIEQVRALLMEFNLAMSSLHTDAELVKAKQEFVLQVGRITHRDCKEVGDVLMQASMLPLISADSVGLGNEEQASKFASQIIRVMLD